MRFPDVSGHSIKGWRETIALYNYSFFLNLMTLISEYNKKKYNNPEV